MLHALLHNKLKDSFRDPHFKPSEDSLTSSVIGLMQYLPDVLFWKLLRGSCGMQSFLPEDVGEIRSVNFWEKMTPDEECNSNYVEPDVWIECERYDILIEAKKYDSWGQYEGQWKKEIISFNKTCDKELIYIALGGNISLKDCTLDVNGKPYTVYTSSWYNLLSEADKCRQYLISESPAGETGGYIRILNDLLAIFAKHGYLRIEWLEKMERISIGPDSAKRISALWEFDNKALLQDFYKSAKPITINTIYDVWN